MKEQFYHDRKHLKNKSTKDIGLSQFSDNGIFVSESLTSKNKLLFKDCLKFKIENNYKYIWTQNGRIYLRKDKDCPARIISNQQDLNGTRYILTLCSVLDNLPRLELFSSLIDADVDNNVLSQVDFNYYSVNDFQNNESIRQICSENTSFSVIHSNVESLAANHDKLTSMLSNPGHNFM